MGSFSETGVLRWGVLGAAKIAVEKVIPAIQKSSRHVVSALASRDLDKAQTTTAKLNIPRAYGSYEQLLADPEIDAVYNPLPNHLHVPWSIKAADAKKHVLCEKPIALTAAEVDGLIAARDRNGVIVGEAFMARTHPQWLMAKRLVEEGAIGELRLIQGHFSYFNRDPKNVRSNPSWGGGGMLDIGCYPIALSRMIFGSEPSSVISLLERDPDFQTDRLASCIMQFAKGQAMFSCSTQLVAYQRMILFGTKARIEVRIPFNAIPDQSMGLWLDDGSKLADVSAVVHHAEACDQYTVQADRFADAIAGHSPVAVSLEEARRNMSVIDAIFQSAETGSWATPKL
jgi:predicted dehydrogenase